MVLLHVAFDHGTDLMGGSLGQLPPPKVCGALLNGEPLPYMRLFLVPMKVDRDKITLI